MERSHGKRGVERDSDALWTGQAAESSSYLTQTGREFGFSRACGNDTPCTKAKATATR
jgi:hypothetical protein